MSAPMFERAPASKALAMSSVLFTSAGFYLDLHPEGLGRRFGPKALIMSQTMFKKFIPEMILGLGLIYVMRQIEREVGTRKFVSFCFASTTLSVSLQLILLSQASILEENRTLAPGPYAPIFSLMALYCAYVPAIGTPVGGFKISHKIPVYVLGLLLASQDGKVSLVPACCAVVAGVICLMQLKKLVMPESIARFGAKYIEPLFRSSEPGRFPRRDPRNDFYGARQFGMFDGQQEGGGPQDDVLLPNFFGGPPPSAAVNAVPEPREEDIQTLVGMGFDAAAAAAALRRNRNDVNRAADQLLGGM